MPERSEGNNYTSKINVSPVLHMIFFPLRGQKMDLFFLQRATKCTFSPARRKNNFFPQLYNILFFLSRHEIFLLAGHKVHFISPWGAEIVYCATRGKKIYFASLKFHARWKMEIRKIWMITKNQEWLLSMKRE